MRIPGAYHEHYEPEVVIVHEIDWLVLDFLLECYKRINKRLEEYGIDATVEPFDEMPHYQRRPHYFLMP